ncbi:MAG: ABC transporter ATP-binding protein [Chloroflexi bacterium]|nr:ABC transporter ATP-binding protein [Chloroflexota bacterium]
MPSRYCIENVTKIYGGAIIANNDISLDIQPGEVFGLLGPNGAGKSTLVQQLVGLLRPDKGQIFYDERPVDPGDLELKRRVAYLSQRPLALLDLTVREAITFTGRLRGLHANRATTQAGALIDLLGLADSADRVVARLSGGQHRLVALGSALIGGADTLVLDEPTNELDPEMRRRVWALLQERCREQGTTIVLVTHNALEAEQVIERLAVLVNGRVIARGTPGTIKARIDSRIRIELTFREGPQQALPELSLLGDMLQPAANRVILAAPRDSARWLIDRVLAVVSLEDLDDFRVLTPTLEDVYLQVAARGAPEIPVEAAG